VRKRKPVRKETFEYVSVKQRNRLLGREKSRAKSQGELLEIAVDFAELR